MHNMKTVTFLLSLCAVSVMLTACSHSSNQSASRPEGIVLNLELTGLPDSTEMQITLGATGQPEEAIQTSYLVNGKAQFAFDVEGPRLYNISASHTNGLMNVVMDKGHVATLKAEASSEEQAQGSVPYIRYKNQKVEGTSLQEEYLRRRVNRDALSERYDAYHKITDRAEMLKAEKAFFVTVDSTFKAAFRASADSPSIMVFASRFPSNTLLASVSETKLNSIKHLYSFFPNSRTTVVFPICRAP